MASLLNFLTPLTPEFSKVQLLINTNVNNHHATHSLVDTLHQLGAHHRKVLAQCRTLYLHEQRLVLYEFLASVPRHACTYYLIPSIYSTPLQQRSLKTFTSQIHI